MLDSAAEEMVVLLVGDVGHDVVADLHSTTGCSAVQLGEVQQGTAK